MPTRSEPVVLLLLLQRLRLLYRVRHRALTRRMRKIVRNRYRYVRTYECVAPSQRARHGLRLIRAVLPLSQEATFAARLATTLGDALYSSEDSVLLRLHSQHSLVAVAKLAARYVR